jgi:hypothetical protein
MTRLSEETLNAYLDGELDAAARAEVEAALQADAEARALLERLRTADRLAIEAFAAPMHERPPPALVEAILSGPGNSAADHPAVRVPQTRPWRLRDYALPLAAAVALVAGVAAGAFMVRQSAPAPGPLALGGVPGDSALHRLLESHPSGSALDMDGAPSPVRLGVVTTFRDRHGRPCREVEALELDLRSDPASRLGGGQATAAGVACRDGAGRWIIEGIARLAPSAPGVGFEPAGVPEKDALEGLLTMLGAQRALEPAQEQALIERHWKD